MPFFKVIKNKSYFKRYQTKFRRRREGKTDYYSRKRLITQDYNKYGTPKYRLVARITNSRVTAQIVAATIRGDVVQCQANSFELKKFGLNAGYTNYAAAYATGLLIARRILKKLKLDTRYPGAKTIDGNDYNVQADPETAKHVKRPFKCILDTGLVNTTVGNRVFAVLKGACDGGLYVPHSTKRFPGYSKGEEKNGKYDAKVHRERIFGVHVDTYLAKFKKDLPKLSSNKHQFQHLIKCLADNKVQSVEALFKKIHDEIRKNPEGKKSKTPVEKKKEREEKKSKIKYEDKEKTIIVTAKGKYKVDRRLTNQQRKQNVLKKIAAAKKIASKK